MEIHSIKEIDAYYDIKEKCLYLTSYTERCKLNDSRLENITLDMVRELLSILQTTGVKCDLRTSEVNVKELWN